MTKTLEVEAVQQRVDALSAVGAACSWQGNAVTFHFNNSAEAGDGYVFLAQVYADVTALLARLRAVEGERDRATREAYDAGMAAGLYLAENAINKARPNPDPVLCPRTPHLETWDRALEFAADAINALRAEGDPAIAAARAALAPDAEAPVPG